MNSDPVWLIALGVMILAFVLWSYLGRSRAARWWSRPQLWLDESLSEHLVLALLPGFGLGVVGGGVAGLLQGVEPVQIPLGFLGLFALVWILLGLCFFIPIPRWVMPRWYREMKPPKQKRSRRKAREREA